MRAAAAVFCSLVFLCCGGSTMAPPVPSPAPVPSPTPDLGQVVPTEATGPVRIVFAGASIVPGSTVTGCGSSIEGCRGRLRVLLDLQPPASGPALHARIFLHATNQIACLLGQTRSFELEAGVTKRIEVVLDGADACRTPVTFATMAAVVEGPVENASRQAWQVHYVFAE